MPMPPLPDLAALSLAEIAQLAAEQRLPPVEKWNPTHCGDSEMRIARDGTWFHQGSPIGRINMVRLFSTILRREPDGSHVLVTPVEKLDIAVDDAPFVAVELKAERDGDAATLAFRLNTGDLVTAGPDHPLRFAPGEDGPRPYLHCAVRGGSGGFGRPRGLLRTGRTRPGDRSAGRVERGRILRAAHRVTLAARLRDALSRGMAQDMDVRAGDGPIPGVAPSATPTPAAVLVAITDRAQPGVILTQRPETMRRHPGQVAFPGGRIDPGEDVTTAALREAHEEVALDPALVEVIGTADPYVTGTGFRIVPVLGVIPPDLPLVPSEAEVAAVFEVPLRWLLDPASHGTGHLEFRGERRQFVEMHWRGPDDDNRRIWGATAAMIVNLSRRLQWPI